MARQLCFFALLVSASASEVNPIRKITNMLENMKKEIEEQGEKDKVLFDNFMCFCDNGAADLLKTANDADAAAKAAAAQLEADTAEKAQLESDIKGHEADLAAATKDLEEATNIRDKQIKRAIRSSQHITGGNREDITSFLQGQTPG